MEMSPKTKAKVQKLANGMSIAIDASYDGERTNHKVSFSCPDYDGIAADIYDNNFLTKE